MVIASLSRFILGLAATVVAAQAAAGVPRDLPLPSGEPSAEELAAQIYFVNHFYALDNYGIVEKDNEITVLVNKSAGSDPTYLTVERYLNNNYPAGDEIKAKDLAIFRSGKLRGTGMLIVDYSDDSKSQSYSIWLPALRKIRRFAEPAHDDAWGGTDFTFGDVYLRKPEHETHEILGKTTLSGCLGMVEGVDTRYLANPPAPACEHDGKEVYQLKSTTKRENWWYDHRISYVDTKTYADYRTEYFKGDTMVKIIDRDWDSLNLDDPRAQTWGYWYGKTFDSGHETLAVIPNAVVQFNQDWEEKMWSERTLTKIQR